MEKIMKIDNIADYNNMAGVETLHPLISVIDFSKSRPVRHFRRNFGFYAVFLKDVNCGDLRYGRNYYDYQEGTLVFIAPGQITGVENDGSYFQPKGYGLLFHPDLIHDTSLGRHIHDYTFFSYEVNEALHLSANYFGDLIKKETGKSAQEYIQTKVMDIAKEKIFDTSKSISELAYELGFKYPQHFTRLFKQRVGYTPNEYRMIN